MTWQSRWQCGLTFAFLSSWGLVAADLKSLIKASRTDTNSPVVELRGKLVPIKPPVTHAAFRTESGEIYTLLSNRTSSALFLDTNLQSRTLLLGGRMLPGTRVFEVTRNVRSIREGKVYELFYYCDICSITGIDPGPCMCCRDDVHLIEEPVKQP